MSSVRRNFLVKSIAAGDMSQASLVGAVHDLRNIDNLCMEAIWTGTPTGTIKLQVCLDYDPANPTVRPGTWRDHPTQPATNPAGGASNFSYEWTAIAYPFARFTYSRTSGSGSLDLYAAGKGT